MNVRITRAHSISMPSLDSKKFSHERFQAFTMSFDQVRVFGPKRDEVRGEWRKLYNEELNNLYSLVVKSRRMRWAGHVAVWGRREWCTGVGGEA
jgi:hypothetical protein